MEQNEIVAIAALDNSVQSLSIFHLKPGERLGHNLCRGVFEMEVFAAFDRF
jgi:hypothetical protein